MDSNSATTAREPRIIIVGGGFGGLAAARALRKASARVLLIDKTNHHVFQPLLYQVATSAAAIFPDVLHSTLAPENSLSAYDVAAGANSLACAAIWWPIGFALAAAYFVFVSRRYAGKVSVQRDSQGFY